MFMTVDDEQVREMAQEWIDKRLQNTFRKKVVSVETKYIDHAAVWILELESPEAKSNAQDEALAEG